MNENLVEEAKVGDCSVMSDPSWCACSANSTQLLWAAYTNN